MVVRSSCQVRFYVELVQVEKKYAKVESAVGGRKIIGNCDRPADVRSIEVAKRTRTCVGKGRPVGGFSRDGPRCAHVRKEVVYWSRKCTQC